MSLLEITGATRNYQVSAGLRRGRVLQAVRGIDLAVEEGEILAIVGESGCGKSTLARLLLGIEEPSSGSITVGGKPIGAYGRVERAKLIQPIFQDPYSSLNPRMTVAGAIAAPLEVRGVGNGRSRLAAVHEIMDAVGLARYLAGAYPSQLSGGQRQRVAIARALIGEPKILICDEPTSALDVSVQSQILNLLARLHRSFRLTIVLISHNLSVVGHLADRVAVMYLGKVVEAGPTEAVFAEPRHPYTRELMQAILPPEPGRGLPELHLKGEFPSPLAPPTGCAFHPRCVRASGACREAVPELAGSERLVACHYPLREPAHA
jgi:peptide/nickel transport system ATP-binding protein